MDAQVHRLRLRLEVAHRAALEVGHHRALQQRGVVEPGEAEGERQPVVEFDEPFGPENARWWWSSIASPRPSSGT
ncbi:MAG: hypothetical protein U0228_05810 [Myxococcaceae bacterium]